MRVGLHIKYLLLLSHFNQNGNTSTDTRVEASSTV